MSAARGRPSGLSRFEQTDQMGAVRARRVKEAVDAVGYEGTVELSGIQLGTAGAAMAAAALTQHRDSVTVLAADGCALSGAGAARLGRWAMTASSLTELSLADNPMVGDRGARAVADLVATHPRLHTLRMGATSMSDEGAFELASALQSSRSLRVLSLGSNCLSADGISRLVSALDINRSLTELFLGDPTTWSGGMASGLVSLALQARLSCQRNEAAIAAIRPRQALAWASTSLSRSSPAFVIPADLLEMIANMLPLESGNDHAQAVRARCCEPVAPEAEATFAHTGLRAVASAAVLQVGSTEVCSEETGAERNAADRTRSDTVPTTAQSADDLLAWVSAQDETSSSSGTDCDD